jgi:hypothetical protein
LKKGFKTLAGAEVNCSDMDGISGKGVSDFRDSCKGYVLVVGLDGDDLPEKRGEEGLEGLRDCGTLSKIVWGEKNLDGVKELWDGQNIEGGYAL